MAKNYVKVAKFTAQLAPIFSDGQGPNSHYKLNAYLDCCKKVLQCLEDDKEKVAFQKIYQTRLRGEAHQLISSSVQESFVEAEQLLNRTYLPR